MLADEMLYYFVCMSCKQASDLFLEGELPKNTPSCISCTQKFGSSTVEKRQVGYFIAHCNQCNRTVGMFSPKDSKELKKAPPKCQKCKTSDHILIINPHLYFQKPERVKKRKTPGFLPPKVRENMNVYKDEKLEESITLIKKRTYKEFQKTEETVLETTLEFPPGEKTLLLTQSEVSYRDGKKKRKLFDTKYGKLPDTKNPQKTSLHPGKVVSFEKYKKELTSTGSIGKQQFPKLNKSAPTVVNSAKLVDRNTTWDYRELGPNSFLRRLCSLLYMIEFPGGTSTTNNPVEVQALWANGSLFLSSNNYTFSQKLLDALKKEDSLQKLLGKLELDSKKKLAPGDYKTSPRNFGTFHMQKMAQYKTEFVKNSYQKYFEYKWRYVFDDLKAALQFDSSNMGSITILNDKDEQGFEYWTCKDAIQAGKLYVVLPNSAKKEGGTFKKKKIHAEELFYPILMDLEKNAKLSKVLPAFVGGVKTPCRTCAEVLKAAAKLLKERLILPTDAFGHYWEASGMHVPDVKFNPKDVTMVFGSEKMIEEGSINIFNTEMPPSPEHK